VAAQQLSAAGITRILISPLRQGERIVGVLGPAFRGRDRSFTVEQRQVANGIARLVPLSLATAALVEEVAKANEVKSHFVATLSHELRNLVAALRGYTFFLRSGGRLGEQDANAVSLAEACARELGELVNATLDLSRFDTKRVQLDLKEVDLSSLLHEMAREVLPLAEAKGIEVAVHAGTETLGATRTDPMKLRMVLRNLLTNAVKFTESGRVTLEAEREGDAIELRVRDTGIGIPVESLATIFEPFEQAHGRESRSKGGVGLGLYLVQRLVNILGGAVSVESEVGCGSTFRIRLPADSGAAGKEEQGAGKRRSVRSPRAQASTARESTLA
jgi:signal transduction histidine kinase